MIIELQKGQKAKDLIDVPKSIVVRLRELNTGQPYDLPERLVEKRGILFSNNEWVDRLARAKHGDTLGGKYIIVSKNKLAEL